MNEIIGMSFSMMVLQVSLVNISKIKIKIYEHICMFIFGTLLSYSIFITSDTRFIANISVLVLLLSVINKKIKILSFSMLVTSLVMVTSLFSSNLAQTIIAILPHMSVSAIYEDNIVLLSFYRILTFIISFLISKFLGNFLDKKLGIFSIELKTRFSIYMIIGALLVLSLYYVNIFMWDITEYLEVAQIIITVLMALYFLFLVVAVYTFTAATKTEMEIKHHQELLQNLQSYTNHIEGLYSEIRSFRHDHLNIISSIFGYVESKDIEGLGKYFTKEIQPISNKMTGFNTQIDRLKFIKLPELKGLLALKLMYAQDMGIKVEIDICEDIENVVLDIVNLCRVAGILIDNAIEECAKAIPNSSLKSAVVNKKGNAEFIFINTIHSEIINASLFFEKGYSTKGENRGLGLYNLQNILCAHEGTALSTTTEGNEFIQILSCKTNQ